MQARLGLVALDLNNHYVSDFAVTVAIVIQVGQCNIYSLSA